MPGKPITVGIPQQLRIALPQMVLAHYTSILLQSGPCHDLMVQCIWTRFLRKYETPNFNMWLFNTRRRFHIPDPDFRWHGPGSFGV